MGLSIVIPTYNERDNIQKLLREIQKEFKEKKIEGEIIVVDDNSPDGTGQILDALKKKQKNLKVIPYENPDEIKIDYDFGGEEGILIREFFHPSWKAKDSGTGKRIPIYKTANNMMLLLPGEGVERVVVFQSKTSAAYIGWLLTILAILFLLFWQNGILHHINIKKAS